MPPNSAVAGLPLLAPRRLFGELGLGPFDTWAQATVARVDSKHALVTVTGGDLGRSRGPTSGTAPMTQDWPAELARYAIDWLGPVVRPDTAGLAGPVLQMDDLIIEGWWRRVIGWR